MLSRRKFLSRSALTGVSLMAPVSSAIVSVVSKSDEVSDADFMKACQAGDLKFVEQAISKNQDRLNRHYTLNSDLTSSHDPLMGSTTPLIEAIASDHIEIVRSLISHGADPNYCLNYGGDNFFVYPLDRCKSLPVMKLLVEGGAEVYSRQLDGDFLLLNYSDNFDMFSYLLDSGASIDATIYGTSVLHIILEWSGHRIDKRSVEKLISAGYDRKKALSDIQSSRDSWNLNYQYGSVSKNAFSKASVLFDECEALIQALVEQESLQKLEYAKFMQSLPNYASRIKNRRQV